jgi:hypothetical protein
MPLPQISSIGTLNAEEQKIMRSDSIKDKTKLINDQLNIVSFSHLKKYSIHY